MRLADPPRWCHHARKSALLHAATPMIRPIRVVLGDANGAQYQVPRFHGMADDQRGETMAESQPRNKPAGSFHTGGRAMMRRPLPPLESNTHEKVEAARPDRRVRRQVGAIAWPPVSVSWKPLGRLGQGRSAGHARNSRRPGGDQRSTSSITIRAAGAEQQSRWRYGEKRIRRRVRRSWFSQMRRVRAATLATAEAAEGRLSGGHGTDSRWG